MTITAGDSKSLSAIVLPVGAPQQVVWSSSDESVLTVAQNGSVVAIAEGSADAIATAANGIQSACKVTVRPVTT